MVRIDVVAMSRATMSNHPSDPERSPGAVVVAALAVVALVAAAVAVVSNFLPPLAATPANTRFSQ